MLVAAGGGWGVKKHEPIMRCGHAIVPSGPSLHPIGIGACTYTHFGMLFKLPGWDSN